MPLTYNEISSITEKKFIPKLYDNIFNSNPLLQRIKKKSYEKLDGGERIMVPLNYALISAAGWYNGADTLDTTANEVMSAAEYTWKQNYVNVTILGREERQNAGSSQVLDIVKNKVKVAEKTMMDSFSTGLYNAGSTTNAIIGLRSIAASITSTVGGISQASYSWWQPQLDSSTTTLSIAKMQERHNLCSVNNDKPTVIATTRTLYNSYYGLLQPQQRFNDSASAKGGFDSLMFNGVPVLPDSYCPANYMFFLNENYLHMFVHKDCDMKFEAFQKPINQDVKVAKILWMGAFGTSNMRLQGAMSALTA